MRVKECCCGCKLRTGTLILLWLVVIESLLGVGFNLMYLLRGRARDVSFESKMYAIRTIMVMYSLADSIVGLLIAFEGVIAVERNLKRHLLPFFYYFLYLIVFNFIAVVIIAYDSEFYGWAFKHTSTLSKGPIPRDERIMFGGGGVIAIAMNAYFAVVVRSYYQEMAVNDDNNGYAV